MGLPKTYHVRLSEYMDEELELISNITGLSKSAILRMAIFDFIKEFDTKVVKRKA